MEDSANFGLLIDNGEFISFHGPDPTMVRSAPATPARCALPIAHFGGRAIKSPKLAGRGTTGFADCTFCAWDSHNEGRCALQVESGNVLVRGCDFQLDKPQIELGADVKRAVISDNVIRGKLRIENHSTRSFQIHDNAAD